MAVPNPVFTNTIGESDGSVILATWTLTTADHTGKGLLIPEWADRTGQFVGTWGGATAAWEGSNDDTVYGPMHNAAGAASITATADANGGPFGVIELPLYMRPKLTTVGVGATIVCTLLLRRANPMRS
ncbi:MAG: hypothetical protein Q7R68_10920 [Nitrospirales bacterium]|nr:hypothetical protein [Nitrospirales bacterium]